MAETEQQFEARKEKWLKKYANAHGQSCVKEINDIIQELFYQTPVQKLQKLQNKKYNTIAEKFAGINKEDITFHTGFFSNDFYVKYKGNIIFHIDDEQNKTFGSNIKRNFFGSKCTEGENDVKIMNNQSNATFIMNAIIAKTRIDNGITSINRNKAITTILNDIKLKKEQNIMQLNGLSQLVKRLHSLELQNAIKRIHKKDRDYELRINFYKNILNQEKQRIDNSDVNKSIVSSYKLINHTKTALKQVKVDNDVVEENKKLLQQYKKNNEKMMKILKQNEDKEVETEIKKLLAYNVEHKNVNNKVINYDLSQLSSKNQLLQ